MTDMTPTPETKPQTLSEKFSRVAAAMTGVALMIAAPVYGIIPGHSTGAVAMGGGVGLGFFVLNSLSDQPYVSVKEAFKRTKSIFPALCIGGIAMAFGAMAQHDVAKLTKHQEEIRQSARSEEVEAVFQAAAKAFCTLKNPPREVKITIGEQARIIPCPQ